MGSDLTDAPDRWLADLLGAEAAAEGQRASVRGQELVLHDGMWRSTAVYSATQEQTATQFAYKWRRRDTFESDASLARARTWLLERYGDVASAPWWSDYAPAPLVLDAGCGAGMSALALFADRLPRVRYLGADVSGAVDVAAARFAESGLPGAFLQADITRLPIEPGSVDVIFSEGVLHHTDSTRGALASLAPLLRSGGRILFYVYRRKGPLREFSDDLIRARLSEMTSDEGWDALMSLTKLGRALGELDVQIDVPEEVELLGIPAGPIDLQRLFYWHVCKAFYDPDLSLDELNHINFDWYAPSNAHRQTEAEVRQWCTELDLVIERERIEEAGITIIARRGG